MERLNKDSLHKVEFRLNGQEEEGYAEPRMLLTDFLRHEIGATGTHVGCEHGVCGACTVMVEDKPVRGCLMLAVQVKGKRVETIESLGNDDGSFGDLQQAFHEHFALQCGYCTPGILMTLKALANTGTEITEASIRNALSGNICRCTGYSEIVQAALAALGGERRQTAQAPG